MKRINPIQNWWTVLAPPNDLEPKDVVGYALQSIGLLEAERDRARREETSLAGRIARFVSFPAEVRRLAGFQTSAGKAAAFSAGVIVQGVLVTVLGGVLLAVVLALVKLGT